MSIKSDASLYILPPFTIKIDNNVIIIYGHAKPVFYDVQGPAEIRLGTDGSFYGIRQ